MSSASGSPVDDALERAITALNEGDTTRAQALAEEVLAADGSNRDAIDLLRAGGGSEGELRRLTVMFCDLVGSTALSQQLETEPYRQVVAQYGRRCRAVIEERFGGWLVSFKGDGVLAAFGYPEAHENDAERAVLAGLDIVASVVELADAVQQAYSAPIGVRVAVHKGLVYVDLEERDLYGFAVNLAARLEGMADPGTVLVSDEVHRLLVDRFEFQTHEPREAKGIPDAIVTHTALAARPRTAAARPARRAPLIGRDAELATLRAAWQTAQAAERAPGACVALLGEGGIGKTRLADAVEEEVRVTGGTIVELAGSPFHTDVGLWPVRQLLEQRTGIRREHDATERLGRLDAERVRLGLDEGATPLLAALAGLAPAAGYDPHEADARQLRDDVVNAARAYVERALGTDPALLRCEDAHWFDGATSELVTAIVKGKLEHIAVLITSRTPEPVPRTKDAVAVELGALAYPDRLALLRALGGEDLPLDDLIDIAGRSDGIPLYVEELLHGAVDAAARGAGPGEAPSVPEPLYEPLVARLNVGRATAAVASAVAVIGREADIELLEVVADMPRPELEIALGELVDRAVLGWQKGSRNRVRFRHELQRAVVYEILTPTRRRELHGRLAVALVKLAADDAAIDWPRVADHFELAERPLDAAEALDQAVLPARRRGALLECRTMLTRAIALVEADPSRPAELEIVLRRQRGFLLCLVEGPSSPLAAADYERCLELAMEHSQQSEMHLTLIALWAYDCTRGDFDRGDRVLDTLVRVTSPDDISYRFFADSGAALMAAYRGQFAEAVRRAEAADATITATGVADFAMDWTIPIDGRASNYVVLAVCGHATGDPHAADTMFKAARDACARLPFPQGPVTFAAGLSFEVWLHLERGDFKGAASVLDDMLEVTSRHSFDSWGIVGATQREIVEGLRAAHDDGPEEERRAAAARHAAMLGTYLSMFKMVDQYVFAPWYFTKFGAIQAAAGDKTAAAATYDESDAIAERTGQHFYDSEIARERALLLDDPVDREAGLRLALDLARGLESPWFELKAALDLHACCGDVTPIEQALAGFVAGASGPVIDDARRLVSP